MNSTGFNRPENHRLRRLLTDCLAGRLEPIVAARKSRAINLPRPAFIPTVKLSLGVGRYCFSNLPEPFVPASFLGRLTYSAAMVVHAFRVLRRGDLQVVRLPGRVMLGGRPATQEEIQAFLDAPAGSFSVTKNGETLLNPRFVLNHSNQLVGDGDIIILPGCLSDTPSAPKR